MYILAIETTGPFGSVALVTGESVVGELVSKEEMNHLKDLLPMTQRLLRDADVAKSMVTHIAVSKGPGSFTGIRIGVATARALGQALNLPVIGVPTLETFRWKEAAQAAAVGSLGAAGAAGCHSEDSALGAAGADGRPTAARLSPVVCGILNARRGQVYGIVEGFLEGGPYMLTEVLAVITDQVKETGRPVMFYGDGIDAYEEKILEILGQAGMTLDREFFFAPVEDRYQNAAAVGKMAAAEAAAGRVLSYNELHPDYMRKAEAEQKLEAGQLPICKLPAQE
jgi:tRNA threonylcarbamoyladenosine biosynthesis protein TsaB